MGLLPGFKKVIRNIKTSTGYSRLSHWTSAQTVEMDDGTTLQSNKSNWDDKYTKNEIDNKFSSFETQIDWKESVNTYDDIINVYPTPQDGWTVNVKDTDYTYRWNGTEWVVISANAIPKATQYIDGLLSKEDKTRYDDANNKKHTHNNKSSLDLITSDMIDKWNSNTVSTVNGQTGDVVITPDSILAKGVFQGDIDTLINGSDYGSYWITPNAGGTKPIDYYFNLLVFNVGDTNTVQIAVSHNGNGVAVYTYVRNYINNVWSAWRRTCDDGNAAMASCASTLASFGNPEAQHMSFNYYGQPGQPAWVWGSNSGNGDINYVYNPSNFNVDSAKKDGNGNVIADTYLPLAGGTITGNLRLKGSGDYGNKLNFGDGDYVHLYEDTDDHLEIKANNGISIITSDINRFVDLKTCDLLIETGEYSSSNPKAYGLSLRGKGRESSITVPPSSSSGFGGANIFDGLICADNIDSGYIDYISRTYGGHCFISIDTSGNVTGRVHMYNGTISAANVTTTGGDYAEYWEYQDTNSNNEDRTGLFVAFVGNKIRIAQKGDNLAKIGVISAAPSIVGDGDQREWVHKYQKDVYGRDIWEDVEQEDGTVVKDRVLNPEYDETKQYIKRADRPEWDAVGTHGKLVVRDDGTCQPDGFCVPADGGIATAADEGFYVMERLDESHIRIYMR